VRAAMDCIPMLVFCFISFLIVRTATPTDTINTAQFIRDGDTIVSAGGTYGLGFFSGCIRKPALNCSRDGFRKLLGVKNKELVYDGLRVAKPKVSLVLDKNAQLLVYQ